VTFCKQLDHKFFLGSSILLFFLFFLHINNYKHGNSMEHGTIIEYKFNMAVILTRI
jgi:hypothetical protein